MLRTSNGFVAILLIRKPCVSSYQKISLVNIVGIHIRMFVGLKLNRSKNKHSWFHPTPSISFYRPSTTASTTFAHPNGGIGGSGGFRSSGMGIVCQAVAGS